MDFSIDLLQVEFDNERLKLLHFLYLVDIVKKEDIKKIFNDYKRYINE